MDLFPNLGKSSTKDSAPEKTDAELRAERVEYHRNHVRNGPRPTKTMTNGQYRRLVERAKATERRKTNIKHRRGWMANQHAIARLRGQLEYLDDHALAGGGWEPGTQAIQDNLTVKFGSVEAAYDRYALILAEQAA